jgi:hypothetical protein
VKRTPLSRRVALPARSTKRTRILPARRALVASLLTERPWCEFPLGCTERAVDVHELRGRGVGGSMLDLDNCRTSCRFHNGWADDNPVWAYAIDWKRNASWREAS